MKRCLLLLLIIISSCSKSDSSSNNSFRDLNSSVYWLLPQNGGYWITFSPDYLIKEIYPPDPDRNNCTIYFQGVFTDQEYVGRFYSGSNTVLIEDKNFYSFSMSASDDRGRFYESIHQFELIDNKLYWTPPSGYYDNETRELIISQGPPPSQGNNCSIRYVD
jgi:hypothetical protein